MDILAIRIRQLRIEHNMTQQKLASKLHVQRTTLAGYEAQSRHPPLETLVHIADIFGVTTDYLLGRTDKKN